MNDNQRMAQILFKRADELNTYLADFRRMHPLPRKAPHIVTIIRIGYQQWADAAPAIPHWFYTELPANDNGRQTS